MKFDFCIGNPPYQEETTEDFAETNGQKPKKNIFHYFQMEADKLAKEGTCMIYPAIRWMHRSGKGMDKFGLEQINDKHLSRLVFYPDSGDVFSGVAIADGVGIVIKDMQKNAPDFQYHYNIHGEETVVIMRNPGEELIPVNPKDLSVTEKVSSFVVSNNLGFLHDRILPRSLFGIESNFIQSNPKKARLMTDKSRIDYDKEVKLLTNDKAGKSGRAKWFVVDKETIPSGRQYVDEWQVIVSSANAGGQKRDNQIEVVDNHSAFGRVRVALASFSTEGEARNFYKYATSYLVRFMFLMTDEALTTLGKRVPDIMDYSSCNQFIDFNKDIDGQLYSLFRLSKEDIEHIHDVVDSIRHKK